MNKIAKITLGTTFLVLLTSCGNREEQKAPEPSATAEPAAAASAPIAPVAYADTLTLTMSKDKFRTQVGQLSGDKAVSNGSAGYLLFGPYAPMQAGTYNVIFKGSVDALPAGSKVRLDVASGKGKVIHGSQEVAATGELSGFDVALANNVDDLEVRVQVPKDSKVAIESYQLVKKN